jgi:hypothetical protein
MHMTEQLQFEEAPVIEDAPEGPHTAAIRKVQRVGQHKVRAVVRTYSNEGDWAIRRMMAAPRHKKSILVYLTSATVDHTNLVNGIDVAYVPMRLWYVEWLPRPTKNEWNTESDFRQNLQSYFGDRWYDVLTVKYEWSPLP